LKTSQAKGFGNSNNLLNLESLVKYSGDLSTNNFAGLRKRLFFYFSKTLSTILSCPYNDYFLGYGDNEAGRSESGHQLDLLPSRKKRP
jgi:hypothetical protein